MKLGNWFEISELEYAQYRLAGYQIEAASDLVVWRLDSKYHRTDGPAFIGVNGFRAWFLNGIRHRTDGPAVIWANGNQEWYLNGRQYTESEWHTACDHLLQNPDITHAVSEQILHQNL